MAEIPYQLIYDELVKILSLYSPPLTAKTDYSSRYELISKKEVEWQGRKFPEMYFGAAMIHKGHVGFYMMSVYANPLLLEKVPEALRKCLKGKSCFHIKKWDDQMKKEIEKTVKDAFSFYRKVKFI